MNWAQRLKPVRSSLANLIRKNPFLFMFAVAGLLLTASEFANYTVRPWTSDDVIIQTLLHQHFHLTGSGKLWLGEDNYILKAPIYWLTNDLFTNSRHVVLVTLLLFNLSGLALFCYSYTFFIKRFKLIKNNFWLPLIWLFSLTGPVVLFLYNPNLRNLEIGLAFILIVFIIKYLDGDISFSSLTKKLLVGLLVILVGLFYYSDPFFTYMVGLPLLIFITWRLYYEKNNLRLRNALGFLLASLILQMVWHKIFLLLGIITRPTETHFINYSDLWSQINRSIFNYFNIFSANFWGANLLSAGTLRTLVNFFIMIFVVVVPLYLLLRKSRLAKDPWAIFLLLQPLFVTLVYTFSNNSELNGIQSVRFLAMLPFYVPFIIVAGLEIIRSQKLKQIITSLLVLSLLLNVAFIFDKLSPLTHTRPNPNQINSDTVKILEQKKLYKGYGDYWDSSINSYLSNYRLTVIRSGCLNTYHWLIDDKALSIPANHSFYLYDSQYITNCSQSDLAKVLGPPAESIKMNDYLKILVYNYDITSRMNNTYFY